MFSWRSKKQLLPPHITQEIAQVFSENYYYAKQVDFTVFLNRFGGKKCTVQQLKGGIDELKCDPYTGLGVITGGERFAPPDYMDFLDGTFYWKLNHFGEIEWVIRHIKGGNYSHIIIDLADNWGGSIRNMLRIAELLVPAKELLCLRYREH